MSKIILLYAIGEITQIWNDMKVSKWWQNFNSLFQITQTEQNANLIIYETLFVQVINNQFIIIIKLLYEWH